METSQTLLQPRLRQPSPGGDEGQLLLGRYRLLQRLGAGGFGVVWRAEDEQLHREVALKRIPLPAPEDRERATREALAGARLSHPAIVALYEACSDDSAFYLISELVHGETLAELIAADDLADEQIREVGIAVAEALAHAHSRGVIHRDVKPQNVIVVAEPRERLGVAKLADFGGAQLVGEEALTRPGDVLGTLAYMAPEQSEGQAVGEATDVYALALVLYEAFSGVQPVKGATPAATARRIGRPIESLRRHRRDLPRALTDAVDAALHPDPDRRATLDDLRGALQERLGGPDLGGGGLGDGDLRDEGLYGGGLGDRHPGGRPAHTELLPAARARRTGQGERSREQEPEPERRRPLGGGVPRAGWLALAAAVVVWQGALGRFGLALVALAAAAPLLALPRRLGPAWLGAALAPALGLIGLAGAYPALAGQATRWRARAGLGVLGFWWLALAEPLLGRRLWCGPLVGTPAREAWEGSLAHGATDVLGPLFTPQLLVGAALWAAAAAALPWVVRGRSAALDVAGAVTWTVALLAARPLLEHGLLGASTHPDPRGALLGATLGCLLAVGARALRGPV